MSDQANEVIDPVTGSSVRSHTLAPGENIDPITGAAARGQEFAVENPLHRGDEQLGYRDNSPVPDGTEAPLDWVGGLEQPAEYGLQDLPEENSQDALPIRYEDGQSYSETSETGNIGGADITPTGPRVQPKFTTELHEAVPTFERAATSHNTRVLLVGVGATPLVLRRGGRKYLVVSCPTLFTNYAGVTSTPLGFQVADDRAIIESGQGYQVNPGDSLEIDTEGPVFVGPLPTNTTAYVQYSEAYSVPGGPVGM